MIINNSKDHQRKAGESVSESGRNQGKLGSQNVPIFTPQEQLEGHSVIGCVPLGGASFQGY